MASQDISKDIRDITVCPICFDTFKNPRCIPCSHTFCHNCLHKHIVATMSTKTSLTGFHCPICREFVPDPTKSADPEKWAEYFPKNLVVEFIIDNGGYSALKHCKPCRNDNEEEEANEMCRTCMEPLCKMCAKYHKRGTVTKHHDVIPLHEFEKLVHGGQQEMVCERHNSRPFEVFCYDHKTTCCILCSIDEHKLCRHKDTIENEAHLIEKGGEDDVLLSEIENIYQNLHEFKSLQEKNRTKIEDKADEITEETKKIRQQIVEKLDSLENEHLEKLAKAMKSARKAMDENMEFLSDLLDLSNHCKKTLQNAKTTKYCLNYVHSFHQVRKQVKRLKSTKISLKEIDISVKFTDIFRQFIGSDQWSSLSHREKSKQLSIRVNPQSKLN